MRLAELLASLPAGQRAPTGDLNVSLLERRLESGRIVTGATLVREGLDDSAGPWLVVRLSAPAGQAGDDELIPVGLGERGRALLEAALDRSRIEISGAPPVADSRAGATLRAELAELIRLSAALEPEERAARLMDWIMDRTDASRCALVPIERGACGPPLAFHLRGTAHRLTDPRHLPRRVLEAVARTRQPIVSHEERAAPTVLAPGGTVERQGIRSYMAVPVVFRGDLLAIAYVDRLDRSKHFTPDEQASFQAFGYELARPVLLLREQQARRDYEALRDEALDGARGARAAVAPSPALASVITQADRLARHADSNLLILGETGVGKEWLARRIHHASGRSGPFVAVSVSALPSDLIEAELFGSHRGAFTGAIDRRGRIAEAEGGTLFLDEVGDLDLADQVKLLRFLQDGRVRALGGREERVADVRVVAATNRDVRAMAREGTFRADLLHRFAPPLEVPPLRRRRDEIMPLADAWLENRARQAGIPRVELDASARALVAGHDWPGNVRQLQAVLAHALLLAPDGRIDAELLQSLLGSSTVLHESPRPTTWPLFREWLDAEEAAWLRMRLQEAGGNVEAAARRLDCPRTTLRHALKRHGIAG